MFKPLATSLLQHLIAQNSWANAMLQPFAGKSVQINIPPASTALVILENGSLAIAGETNIANATVTIPPSLLLRLMAKDEAAKLQINITGNTHLATELAKVFTHIRWDYEDDLSKLVGDVPAYKVGQFARNTAQSAKESSIHLAEMLAEYWQEANPLIATKHHVEEFNAQVDTLRSDVERFEKRFAKLMQRHSTTNQSNGSTVDNNQ